MKTNPNTAVAYPIRPAASVHEEVIVLPEANVLPKGPTRDEVDVHWHFNWSDADLERAPGFNVFDQTLLGRRVHVDAYISPDDVEPTAVHLAAAARSRRIGAILARLSPLQRSVLERWAAPPARFPSAVRSRFGRLSAVTALTRGFAELGAASPFVEACAEAVAKRDDLSDITMRRKLDEIFVQASHLAREAFSAYAKARTAIDAEIERIDAARARARAPKLTALTTRTASNTNGGAMARLLAKRGGR